MIFLWKFFRYCTLKIFEESFEENVSSVGSSIAVYRKKPTGFDVWYVISDFTKAVNFCDFWENVLYK